MLLIPFIRFGAHKPNGFLAPFVIHYLSAVMVFEWAYCLVMIYQPLCTPWMHVIVMCDNKDILNLNLNLYNAILGAHYFNVKLLVYLVTVHQWHQMASFLIVKGSIIILLCNSLPSISPLGITLTNDNILSIISQANAFETIAHLVQPSMCGYNTDINWHYTDVDLCTLTHCGLETTYNAEILLAIVASGGGLPSVRCHVIT